MVEVPFTVPRDRKSSYDPQGDVSVNITNDTQDDVTICWINYDGHVQDAASIAAGEGWSQDTNSEHPWLIQMCGSDLACVCFTRSADVRVSEILRSVQGGFTREEKVGYLAGGGDFASGLSQKDAETSILANPHVTMGYTYLNDDPDSCWVKTTGTPFCEAEGWTAVVYTFDQRAQTATQARQKRNQKRHNVVDGGGGVCDSSWKACCHDAITCEAMSKTYTPYDYGGFTFFIEDGCLEKHEALHGQITGDVEEITRVLPQDAIALLKAETCVWINDVLQYPSKDSPQFGAYCHWGAQWLQSMGDLAEKGSCVEICQASHYINWVRDQPALLLHELSHAYHCIRQAQVDEIIKHAYEEAMASGKYETEEMCGHAGSSKPYCAGNPAEFFAESSEAFFSSQRFRNDYFPYVHSELKGFDDVAYKMCEDVWGIKGDDLPSRMEVPRDWLERLAKVDESVIAERFKAADLDDSGTLSPEEFASVVSSVAPTLGPEETKSLQTFADADKDGVINYLEFSAWLTSQIGAFKL
eukprot:TRINITY_DN75304_c0_g1_i1.p1 TRINITY_DN75304_c0_g1~~TRINITY_DN75304_c0_g1_i1.p1  ORF type:complete len:538 (+),score=81.55 TRINITY_DN75304_c0_g1_i1:35-1615(+)